MPIADHSNDQSNLDSVLRKVRSLIARAEHEGTDPTEADRCRTMADALMLKYAIDDAGKAQEPGSVQSKPIIISVEVGPDSEVIGYVSWLIRELCTHCRCRVRMYSHWADGSWYAKIYGFESDVRYFELMYTTVRLHMLGVLLPKIDSTESLDDNAYRLHNSGYNWLQIADMYGWQKDRGAWYHGEYNGTRPPAGMKVPYWHKEQGWQPATTVGGIYKRAYYRACAARGEQPQKIAANGTTTYRKSAADGYVGMIGRRLYMMRKDRTSGAELILRSRIDDLDALFKQDNPDLFPEKKEEDEEKSNAKPKKTRAIKFRPMPVNADAYRRGATHARSADLNGSSRVGGQRGSIGH